MGSEIFLIQKDFPMEPGLGTLSRGSATHLQDASFEVTFSQAFSKVNPPSCPCIQ